MCLREREPEKERERARERKRKTKRDIQMSRMSFNKIKKKKENVCRRKKLFLLFNKIRFRANFLRFDTKDQSKKN